MFNENHTLLGEILKQATMTWLGNEEPAYKIDWGKYGIQIQSEKFLNLVSKGRNFEF